MKFIRALSTRWKTKVWPYAKTHKFITAIVLLVVVFGGYKIGKAIFSTPAETRYVVSRVNKGDLKSTVVGTGQVSATNQIELSAKASGNITRIHAKVGQELKAGAIIAQIDSRNIALSLESARLSLQKLTQTDTSSLLQSQNALEDAKQTKIKAEVDITKSYEDGMTAMSGVFADLPAIMYGMNDLYYTQSGFLSDTNASVRAANAQSYRISAGAIYDAAVVEYKKLQTDYTVAVRANATSSTEALLTRSYALINKLGESLKNTAFAIDYIKNHVTGQGMNEATTALNTVNGWISKNNTHLNSIVSARTSIETGKTSLAAAERSLKERAQSLTDVQNGADPLDVRSQQISLQQRQLEYENYIVRAPFNGILAKLNVKLGDSAGSASIGTFITKQKIAEITLNEIDAARVQTGQEVELTFDAIEGLTATGTIASIDLVGTVSQGVVTYATQIAFDTKDERIKPGMSVTATITTQNKEDVLLVPSTAVKTRGTEKYVLVATMENIPGMPNRTMGNASSTGTRMMRNENASSASSTTRPQFSGGANGARQAFQGMAAAGITLPTPPIERVVTTGDSNDTSVEILSGLDIGEFIVTRTISSTSTQAATTPQNNLFNVGGRGTGATGGAALRAR